MAEAKSLLSLIARGYAAGREDAATETLCYILSRSESARDVLSELLGYSGDSLPIASFSTQYSTAGARPDMACLNDDEEVVAFVESKFWAALTSNQPVTYWNALPDDRSATLLFLAPAARIARIDEDSLWDELVDRLRNKGHLLSPVTREKGLVTAKSPDGKHRLLLTSWEVLLDRLARKTEKDGNRQSCFQVAELRGLAYDAIKDNDPVRDANLKRLIDDAVTHGEESGWADTDGLNANDIFGVRYVKYFRLAGAMTGLRIDYKAMKETNKPLWLWFWRDSSVDLEEVRDELSASAERLKWLPKDVCVPIDLPEGGDCEATLRAIVSKLECVARLIERMGPTKQRDQTTG